MPQIIQGFNKNDDEIYEQSVNNLKSTNKQKRVLDKNIFFRSQYWFLTQAKLVVPKHMVPSVCLRHKPKFMRDNTRAFMITTETRYKTTIAIRRVIENKEQY